MCRSTWLQLVRNRRNVWFCHVFHNVWHLSSLCHFFNWLKFQSTCDNQFTTLHCLFLLLVIVHENILPVRYKWQNVETWVIWNTVVLSDEISLKWYRRLKCVIVFTKPLANELNESEYRCIFSCREILNHRHLGAYLRLWLRNPHIKL